MFENETSTAAEGLAPEDREVSLRRDASEARESARNTYVPSWVFVGKYAMPYSEHLIPFRL